MDTRTSRRAPAWLAAAFTLGISMPAVAAPTHGARMVQMFDCLQCHDDDGLPDVKAPPAGRTCAGCHAALVRGRRGGARPTLLTSRTSRGIDQFSSRGDRRLRVDDAGLAALLDAQPAAPRIRSFLAVPSLAAAGARLRTDWIASFLRAPHKVRPALHETMPRLPVSDDAAAALAIWLTARRPAVTGLAAKAAAIPRSTRVADIAAGRKLYAELRCATCHARGDEPAMTPLPEAPDLATVAARMDPDVMAGFIADPAAYAAGADLKMPSYDMAATDAARLRDFLLAAAPLPMPLAQRVTAQAQEQGWAAPTADLPLLDRRVAWNEVATQVFKDCAHCHGPGGPGQAGGLGFEGVDLDLSSWSGFRRGSRRMAGRRTSILKTRRGGQEPVLIERLRLRVREHAAERRGATVPVAAGAGAGMPLGLPAVSPEGLQLVRSWLAQGARGPDDRRALQPTRAGRRAWRMARR